MALRCSLFGHDFDEPTVDHDRAERGSEAVTTIREIETCQRCGERRVVSETTEVTSIEPADDGGDGTGSLRPDLGSHEASADDTSRDSGGDGTEPDGTDDGAEILESGPPDGGAPGREGPPIVDAEPDAPGGPEEPPVDGEGSGDGEGDDEGAERTTDEDAVIIDDTTGDTHPDPADPSAGGNPGLDPEGEPDRGGDPAPEDRAEPRTGTEPEAGDAPPSVDDAVSGTIRDGTGSRSGSESEGLQQYGPSSAISVPEGEYHCPECDFVTAVSDSSLREGDICPACHEGYLIHQQ